MSSYPRDRNLKKDDTYADSTFDVAKAERQELFARSIYQQEEEYEDEEKVQWEGETLRNDQFEKLMLEIRFAFNTNEQCQGISFLDSLAEQEVIFEKSDKIREGTFLESQSKIDSAFRGAQAARDAQSEWHRFRREEHYQMVHLAKDDICEKLKRVLNKQVNTLLRSQEKRFVSTGDWRHKTFATWQEVSDQDDTNSNSSSDSHPNPGPTEYYSPSTQVSPQHSGHPLVGPELFFTMVPIQPSSSSESSSPTMMQAPNKYVTTEPYSDPLRWRKAFEKREEACEVFKNGVRGW